MQLVLSLTQRDFYITTVNLKDVYNTVKIDQPDGAYLKPLFKRLY